MSEQNDMIVIAKTPVKILMRILAGVLYAYGKYYEDGLQSGDSSVRLIRWNRLVRFCRMNLEMIL